MKGRIRWCSVSAAALLLAVSAAPYVAHGDETVRENYEILTVRRSDLGDVYHTGFPDISAREQGISIQWDTRTDTDWEAEEKELLLSGGSLPDAFMGSLCLTEEDIRSHPGMIVPLEDYIDSCMPNLKAILEEDPMMKELACSSGGHIYGLPARRPCRPLIGDQMFINRSWLERLSLSMPQTWSEFTDVLRAFRDRDANGNGDPSDEIPYGRGLTDPVMFFCLPFGITPGADGTDLLAVRDSDVVFLPAAEAYREGIEWMHRCYVEGLIDMDLFTEDDSLRDVKLHAQTPVIGCAAGWTADAVFGGSAGEYEDLPALAGPDGERYIASDPEHLNYSRYEFILTGACRNPEPLLAWIDGFYTDDASVQNYYGSFGTGVVKSEDGTYTVLAPKGNMSADAWAWMNSLRDYGPKYVDDSFDGKVTYEADNSDAKKLESDRSLRQYAGEAYPNVSYTASQCDVLKQIRAPILEYARSMTVRFVTRGLTDAEWEAYLDHLGDLGLEEFLRIHKEAYDSCMEQRNQ